MLNTVKAPRELPRPTWEPKYYPKADEREARKSGSRRQYEKRKAEGRCGYFGCGASAEIDRVYCRKHLEDMSERQKRRCEARKKKGVCLSCGTRPQFWGLRCVICRQARQTNSLSHGAQRALRLYRKAERKFEIEQRQAQARCAIRKLLARRDLNGDHAKALRLYAGLDTDHWRTGVEVGKLMGISRERVRQLLYPSKVILAEMLGGNVPWKPLTPKPSASSQEKSWREPKWARRLKERAPVLLGELLRSRKVTLRQRSAAFI